MSNKSQTIYMTGYARWAKLREDNMDTYEGHFEKSGGRFTVDFYPESEDELDKYWSAGAPKVSMGNQMLRDPSHKSYGDGDQDMGIGSYLKLRRDNHNQIASFGGLPQVFDLRDGSNTKKWDWDKSGEIWNGSKVQVKVSIYPIRDDAAIIRLLAVGVLELGDEPTPQTDDGSDTF